MPNLRINLVLFGIGNLGNTLINQIIEKKQFLLEKRNIDIRFPVIANSTLALFESNGVKDNWESEFDSKSKVYRYEDIIDFVKSHQLENLIVVDTTDSKELVKSYMPLIQNGFNIVAANKNANILHIDFYKELRRNLKKFNKTFLYEANVCSGFPLIQTLNDLHLSGEKITKIRGVFSNSLSYIFNRFSSEEKSFSTILKDAEQLGLTKLDSREDLSGIDIAKKLLVLAREIGKNYELSDITISSLLLPNLNQLSTKLEYASNKEWFDKPFHIAKIAQAENHVLRYVGEFSVLENKLEVKLVSEPLTSSIGQLNGSDTVFEIYTQSYGKIPIVIHGASLEKKVLACGLLTDILKVTEKIKIRERVLA